MENGVCRIFDCMAWDAGHCDGRLHREMNFVKPLRGGEAAVVRPRPEISREAR